MSRAAERARIWPRVALRLARHELTHSASLLRWLTRRGPHGVRQGDLPVAYSGGQAATMYGFLFVSVIETVALALLIPWPLVHLITLVIDVWGCVAILAMQAASVVRPHVVGADGSLRVRYGVLVDIRIPADRIASVRLDRRLPSGRLLQFGEDDRLDLVVGSQTSIAVELTEPVTFRRPLGKPARVRTLRFYADDPRRAVAALNRPTTARPPA